jgi:tetratricopeptide (TPR) repeat protein
MNFIKLYTKIILQIFFFISIFSILNAKNLDKFNKAEKISNYFSGILSFDDNDYVRSYRYLNKLDGLEKNHRPYSKLYQYSLINLERVEEAFDYSIKLEKKGINSFHSNLIIGVYYLKNKKLDKAQEYFRKLSQLDKDPSITAFLSTSLNNWVLFPKKNQDEGLKLINDLNPRFENIKKIQSTLAYCFFSSKNTSNKFTELTINEKTDFSRYNFFHVNYLFKQGKKKKALETLDNSIKRSPQNLILNQFKVDLKNKNYENFSNQFNCNEVPDVAAEIFYITSNLLSSQNLYSLSNFYLNLAKYLNPKFTSFETLYAENFFMIKDYEKSKKIYNKIKKNGFIYNWFASKQISRILIKQERKEEAIRLITKNFKQLNQPNVFQIYDYADFLKNNEMFEESVKYFTEILDSIEKNHSLFAKTSDSRGIAFERLSMWESAEKDLLNSLSVKPNDAYVINYLAYTWIEKGINIEKSLDMLRKANKLQKNDGYIIDSLGWALFKLKKYKESEKQLELAVRIMPSDPVVNDHFGDVLWMNNKFLQARYYWNYVVNLEDAEIDLKKNVKKKLVFGINLDPK